MMTRERPAKRPRSRPILDDGMSYALAVGSALVLYGPDA